MLWKDKPRSTNVEDRRDVRLQGRTAAGAGLLGLLPTIIRYLGFKKTLLLLAVVGGFAYFTGGFENMKNTLVGSSAQPVTETRVPIQQTPEEQQLVDFVAVVLADTEQTWSELFQKQGQTYEKPKLVLFRDAVSSACGLAEAAVGPFYCPQDRQLYIDLGFYDQLKRQLNAPGDFAQAYVIAHEVGHHVQTLLGTSAKVNDLQRQAGRAEANQLSVRQELQADCYAGVWAHHADRGRQLLESGDIEEALNAASAIGDDRLQRQSQGTVRPDSFTHGTSAQRMQWFKTGMDSGEPTACYTFD
jgi:predicted metalloprotease